jgi:hypothetical protein
VVNMRPPSGGSVMGGSADDFIAADVSSPRIGSKNHHVTKSVSLESHRPFPEVIFTLKAD